jgi:hypothetical protein
MSLQSTCDEFGRDSTLRVGVNACDYDVMGGYLARFKGLSWAEINYLVEEEEEEERKTVLTKIHEERKDLVMKGEYELEEGEEL